MPTWGWFIVALVLIDAAVLFAWFLARRSPRTDSAAARKLGLVGLDTAAREEIYRLVGEGKKINAIKLFRERTGCALTKAKAVVDSVERGDPLPAPGTFAGPTGVETGAWEDIIPKLQELKAEGRAITAIKLLRARTGLPLREAKEAVDRL